ncbi:MAG TPA: hypothetical protein VGJ28_26995, partial [Micromonosporaceae bacterium]
MRTVSLFRRIGGILLAVVGLIFLIIGIVLISSQRWTLVTGTVQSCTPRIVHTTSTRSTGHTEYDCQINWQDGGTAHTATVDLGPEGANVGQ